MMVPIVSRLFLELDCDTTLLVEIILVLGLDGGEDLGHIALESHVNDVIADVSV